MSSIPKAVTLAFVFIVVALVVVVDTWLLLAKGYEHTVSAVMYDLAVDYPPLNSALFFCLGHIFWPNLYAARRHDRDQSNRNDPKGR